MWFVALLLTFAQAQEVDIRRLAPVKPPSKPAPIAQPQSGGSIQDISGDWARRQFHLSTNGAVDQFVIDANRTLDRLFITETSSQKTDRSPADESENSRGLRPRTVRMPKLGAFELGLGRDLKLNYDLVNGNELTLSKPIFMDVELRLHHAQTADSLQLNFDW